MHVYKDLSNRLLTFIDDILLIENPSEFRTVLCAHSGRVLSCVHSTKEQMALFIVTNTYSILASGAHVGEISCSTRNDDN